MSEKIEDIEFRVYEDDDAVSIRIRPAQNGYIVKAGKKPYLCSDKDSVRNAVLGIANRYFKYLERPEE